MSKRFGTVNGEKMKIERMINCMGKGGFFVAILTIGKEKRDMMDGSYCTCINQMEKIMVTLTRDLQHSKMLRMRKHICKEWVGIQTKK